MYNYIVIFDFENEAEERTSGIEVEFETYEEAKQYCKDLKDDPDCFNIELHDINE